MPKTKETGSGGKRKTYSDEEAELKGMAAAVEPQTGAGKAMIPTAELLFRELRRMRALPRHRLLTRLFENIGKARRAEICGIIGITYTSDSPVCVNKILVGLHFPTDHSQDSVAYAVLRHPVLQETLIAYLGGPDVLRKAKAEV